LTWNESIRSLIAKILAGPDPEKRLAPGVTIPSIEPELEAAMGFGR
jgi:hypothetical protein